MPTNDNDMILARMRGAPGQPGSAETDADPRNPNVRQADPTLVEELRGWREVDDMSDDARRKLWLMRRAANEIERLGEEERARIVELKAALKAALDILGHPDDRTTQALWAVLENRAAPT